MLLTLFTQMPTSRSAPEYSLNVVDRASFCSASVQADQQAYRLISRLSTWPVNSRPLTGLPAALPAGCCTAATRQCSQKDEWLCIDNRRAAGLPQGHQSVSSHKSGCKLAFGQLPCVIGLR